MSYAGVIGSSALLGFVTVDTTTEWASSAGFNVADPWGLSSPKTNSMQHRIIHSATNLAQVVGRGVNPTGVDADLVARTNVERHKDVGSSILAASTTVAPLLKSSLSLMNGQSKWERELSQKDSHPHPADFNAKSHLDLRTQEVSTTQKQFRSGEQRLADYSSFAYQI